MGLSLLTISKAHLLRSIYLDRGSVGIGFISNAVRKTKQKTLDSITVFKPSPAMITALIDQR